MRARRPYVGIDHDPAPIQSSSEWGSSGLIPEDGRRAVARLLDGRARFTAVFAHGDLLTRLTAAENRQPSAGPVARMLPVSVVERESVRGALG